LPATSGDLRRVSDLIATVPGRFATRCLERFPLQIFDLPFAFPVIQNRVYWHECMHSDKQNRWFRGLRAEIGKA
jgi:hypothetical protein